MKTGDMVNFGRTLTAGIVVALASGANLHADDREIYLAAYSAESTGRPKVIILFDDSGSMDTEVAGQRPGYTPGGGYASAHDSDRIYWSTNGEPPASNSNQYFAAGKNRCAESFDSLDTVGFSRVKRVAGASPTHSCFLAKCSGLSGTRCRPRRGTRFTSTAKRM